MADIGAGFLNCEDFWIVFALAAASLRRALEGMPELAEASKHITIEESSEGLNIEIVDQDGISMFPEGSKEPYERARHLIQTIAGPLKATPYRISSSGTRLAPKPGGQTMGRGICRPTGPTPCARSWRKKAIPRRMSTRWREKPIPNRCSRGPVAGTKSPRHHHSNERSTTGPCGSKALTTRTRSPLPRV